MADLSEFIDDLTDITDNIFDYIIIGGGTAGLCVASRLSEDPTVSVAVLEAGQAHLNDPRILTPVGWLQQFFNADYDWAFKSVPRPDQNDNQGTVWHRGKDLGGSSAINLLAWQRPQRDDIDAFEKLGNNGFNSDVFYEYSKKSERFVAPVNPITSGYRDLYNSNAVGHDGPIPISFSKPSGASGAEGPFQESTKHDVETLTAALSGDTLGSVKSAVIVDPEKDTRSYSTTGYLGIAAGRTNLKILTEAYVIKILISEGARDGLSGTEVELEYAGMRYRVKAAREVILCAGTIMDPKILELSGIGDRNVLANLGVPVKFHLPSVGMNVQEHTFMLENIHLMRKDSGISSLDSLRDQQELSRILAQEPQIDKIATMIPTGMTFIPAYSFSKRADALIAIQRAKIAKESVRYPPGLLEQYKIQLDMFESKKVPYGELWLAPWAARETGKLHHEGIAATVLSHPFSRGSIHISSADSKVTPAIVPNYLEEKIDEELMLDLFKFSRRVTATEPFKSLSECEVSATAALVTDEDIRKRMHTFVGPTWRGVVDANFKLYGTRNIRVVDASIFPLIPSVHIQASVYAIAEMASDIIKGKLVLG